MELISNWVAIIFLLCAIVFLWIQILLAKEEIFLLKDVLAKNHILLSERIGEQEKIIDLMKKDDLELYGEVALLWKKLELLDEAKTHLPIKESDKQEPKKRDQKEKAIKLIKEALAQSPLLFSEIVDFLDQKEISLKKSTISVYLSNDERFESKDGKWQLKKLDESPSV